jgi:hypothetical protein
MEEGVRKLLSITSAAVVALGGFTAKAGEPPAFEKLGFPITQTQLSLLGPAGVQESSPIPMLTLGGMPASPHQLAVLTPRPREAERTAAKSTTAGLPVP